MLIKQNKNSLSASILLLALLNIANIIETLSENPKAGIYIDVVLLPRDKKAENQTNKPIYLIQTNY